MKSLWVACWAESLKVRKSKMFWITILLFAFIASMMGVLMFVAQHPEIAEKSAVLGAKASIFKKVDWPSYFGLLNEVVALIGMIGFGFVASWVFGREYSDRTIKDLLALPISREIIVMAKLIIVGVWCLILAVVLFGVGLAAGWVVKLDGWSSGAAFEEFRLFTGTAFLTILLGGPVAFFAAWGKGYLAPMGYLILAMIVTQFVVAALPGLGAYFPWAIPALFSGVAGAGSPQLGIISYLILVGTSLLGAAATLAWWKYADQH
ncbi:MAG TPA: ABC transporter permease [Bacillota bacterium]|nr:ABC transporter permease [Bacillota bacterium]